MNRSSKRSAIHFLAFSLGVLLLLHGLHKMIHGTEYIEALILDIYLPNVEKKVPCGMWFAPFMPGRVFMGKMFVGQEFVTYLHYIKLLSYGVYLPELIAPLFLIFGRYIRIAAFIIALYMMVMLLGAYKTSVAMLMEFGGWSIESVLLYLIASLLLFFFKISDCRFDHKSFKQKNNKKLN